MVTFLQELVNSLSVASVIILMGIGVTLIFGLTGIINFAHGEFLMLGAIGVWVLMGYGLGYIPAFSSPSPSSALSGFCSSAVCSSSRSIAQITDSWLRSAFPSCSSTS